MASNHIVEFIHCAKCGKERPEGVAPKDWQKISVGFTALGIQVWCDRHDCNIVNLTIDPSTATQDTTTVADSIQ